MQLTTGQRAEYEKNGFLIFPELFSPQEVAVLCTEVERVSEIESKCIIREDAGGPAKIIFRMHEDNGETASSAVRAAARSPRALGVAQQLLDDEAVYLHHCKVNVKAAIQGSAWPWHQDFGTWHLDGITDPHLTTMVVMLDEATEFNGCLYLLPSSHNEGRHQPYWDESTAYKLWAVGPTEMRDKIARYPDPIPITGKPGTAAIFHCNILHASGHNLSAQDRCQMYFCYNRVVNHPKDIKNTRPDYVRSLNWAPLSLESDDLILACGRSLT